MKRFSFSAGALVTAAFAAALVAAAAFGGISGSLSYGQLIPLECIGAGGCAQTANAIDEPTGLLISSDQSKVFVASHSSDSVDILTRDRTKGTLTQQPEARGCVSETGAGPCFDGHGLVGPVDIANGDEDVYVASATSNAVAIISEDPDSKKWLQASGTEGCVSETGTGGCASGYALTDASSVALDAHAGKLFVGSTNAIAFFERNKSTSRLTQKGCISATGSEGPGCTAAYVPGTVTDLTVSSDNKNVYATTSGGVLLEFSNFRGQLTEIGCVNDDGSNGCTDSIAPFVGPEGLQLAADGKTLYVAANGSNTLVMFTRNSKTGLLSPVAGPIGCYNTGGTGGCTAVLGLDDPHKVRVCANRGCVLVSAGDGVASFFRTVKTGALSQPSAPFVPCFNPAGTGGCAAATGLGGSMGIDSISGGIKQMYVAGSTSDAVSEFHLR